MDESASAIQQRYEALKPVLDEQGRRRSAAAEAMACGHGGVTLLSRITGLARRTIYHGIADIKSGYSAGPGRIRRPGGGRRSKTSQDTTLLDDLKALVEPETRGDPMKPLMWTTKSLAHLAKALKEKGHSVCATVVRKLLRGMSYSLQGNHKTSEGKQHQDRDAQFRHINDQVKDHLLAGDPVISVDTKKKNLSAISRTTAVNGGREVRRKPSAFTISPIQNWDVQYLMAFMILAAIADGAAWVTITTPPPLRRMLSAAGG
jgi:hypothetical protein